MPRAIRLDRPADPYPVFLGRGVLDDLGRILARRWGPARVAVVTQRRLVPTIGERVLSALSRAGRPAELLVMPDGERFKTLETVRRLYDALLRRGFGREDGLVALGGGVVGDTAGFVAATYLRGIRYVQAPTTLLAQIDSAIGGKVGVNHPAGKNLVGAFYRPDAVVIDPSVLASLPRRQFRSGLFELLKYGLIGAPDLYRRMRAAPERFRPGRRELDAAIAVAVRTKLRVVRGDEREGGRRRILNFGHTVGHGLEAAAGYSRLTHGEAVGWGMIAAIRLARRRGLLGPRRAAAMESAVRGLAPLPELSGLSLRRVLAAMRHDKKRGRKGWRFVLPTAPGRVLVAEGIAEAELRAILAGLGLRGR